MWNTTEGGPCIFRPVPYKSFDAPHPEQAANEDCLKNQNHLPKGEDGTCQIRADVCPNAKCNDDNILVDAKKVHIWKINPDIPWSETMTDWSKTKRWLMGNDVR